MESNQPIPACFICGSPLKVTLTHSKKGKVAVGLTCPTDGRHLRAFCNHRPFVEEIVRRVADQAKAVEPNGQALQNRSGVSPADGATGRRSRP